ncbi:thioredoxin-domain-containing protein [Sarocladium strictum]
MSTVNIGSSGEWDKLLSGTDVVIADFYADWCGPCKMIAPHYERLAKEHSRPKKVAFAKVNTDNQSDVARSNGISAMPTFKIFHKGACVETIKGANPSALNDAVTKAVKLAGGGATAGELFKSPGRTLGGDSGSGSSGGGIFSMNNLLQVLMAFVGLYLASLFSASGEKKKSKQLPRPVLRVNSGHTTAIKRQFAQRSLQPAGRAFSSSRRWQADETNSSAESVEQFVRDTKQRFRDTLPKGYLNEEELALYLRLYGPPLRETEPDDVGIPSHADMGAEVPKPVNEGTVLRELEGGDFEEITFELPPEQLLKREELVDQENPEAETDEELIEITPEIAEALMAQEAAQAEEMDLAEKESDYIEITPEIAEALMAQEAAQAEGMDLAEKEPDYIDTVAKNQREHDALRKLKEDFEATREKQKEEEEATQEEAEEADEMAAQDTSWPPERELPWHGLPEDDTGPSEKRRFHPLTIEGRFHGSPVEISLPRDELIVPVREMLERTHIKHVRNAAEASFGGVGLPLSPTTQDGQKNGKMDAVGLPPGQRHMTEVEGDAFLAGYLPPAYASSMAVLREVRKRLGSGWLQSMLKRTNGEGPRILDAGAGGGGLVAWNQIVRAEWEILKEKREVTAKEPTGKNTVLVASNRLRDRLKGILHNTTFLPRLPDYQHSGDMDGAHLDAGSQPQARKTYDIVIASHLLMAEKYDHHRQAVLNNLWNLTDKDGGVLIFVEKAHPRGFEAVAHARETLLRRYLNPQPGQPTEAPAEFNPAFHRVLEDGHIIAPCTTHSTCPMYKHHGKSAGRRDFCHFSQRFVAPTFYSKMLSGSSQGEVEFSYVAFQRGVSKNHAMSPEEATEKALRGYEHNDESPSMQQLPRMIMPPLKRTGHITLDLCTPEGKTERWTVPKSFSKLAYHDARKARWGDLWALGAKTRVERTVRIGRGQDDGGLRTGRDGKKGPRRVTITMDGENISAEEKNVGRQRRGKKGKKAKTDDILRELEEDDADVEREVDEEMEAIWAEQEAEEAEEREMRRRGGRN